VAMKSERRSVSTASAAALALFTLLVGTVATTAATANSGRATGTIAHSRPGSSGTNSGTGTAATGSASLIWQAPSTNSDGSPLTNLAGFYIRYGTQPANLNQLITVASASTLKYVVQKLTSGTWYFTVSSYTTDGAESVPSAMVSGTI
jgi:hypothetical protein